MQNHNMPRDRESLCQLLSYLKKKHSESKYVNVHKLKVTPLHEKDLAHLEPKSSKTKNTFAPLAICLFSI